MAEGVVRDVSARQLMSGFVAFVKTWPFIMSEVGAMEGWGRGEKETSCVRSFTLGF